MVIFPLSWPGKLVLILIALCLGFIYLMMAKPELWKKLTGKNKKNKE